MKIIDCTLLLYLSIETSIVFSQQPVYYLYPQTYDFLPDIESPGVFQDSIETITILTKEGKYGIAPVTVENGKPLYYSYKLGAFMGKDNQMHCSADFPELAKTGLLSEEHLNKKDFITGIPIDVINCTARPNGYSFSGFIAEDEDIISVLKSDNQLVKTLGFKHHQMAKPLFHVWNLILKEIELGKWGARFYDNIKSFYYNGNLIKFETSGSKGWQISIFFDEVEGRYNIHTSRELTHNEMQYLSEKYLFLNDDEMNQLKDKLSRLDFSEMLPYYIMKYGFYEGHTDYRCDPVAIAFIFGLKSLQEIDDALQGNLYQSLIDHYTSE
ncbi:MAG: hypothetical protein JW731_16065 [Bacteroidales bacterium]|nr:hypothetical protein [Bacteroidales bacterium]